MKYIIIRSIKAFTLTEVMAVVLILSAMIGIALPNYNNQMRMVRNREATSILRSVYLAQKMYEKEEGQFAVDFADLGVDITDPAPANFTVTLWAPIADVQVDCGSDIYLVKAEANSGEYRLYAELVDATILCCEGAGFSNYGALCQRMGYPAPTP